MKKLPKLPNNPQYIVDTGDNILYKVDESTVRIEVYES